MATVSHTPPDTQLREALAAAGLRVTSQRLVLHRALRELDRHATAEEIAAAAGDRLPGLSMPTVYATLELLERLGLVRRVTGAGNATLFDPGTEPHAHLVCRSCGKVFDVPGAADLGALTRAARSAGMQVDEAEVLLQGVCADCAARQG
jgi:Fe2+ or Zn2+ uptake regulation protein